MTTPNHVCLFRAPAGDPRRGARPRGFLEPPPSRFPPMNPEDWFLFAKSPSGFSPSSFSRHSGLSSTELRPAPKHAPALPVLPDTATPPHAESSSVHGHSSLPLRSRGHHDGHALRSGVLEKKSCPSPGSVSGRVKTLRRRVSISPRLARRSPRDGLSIRQERAVVFAKLTIEASQPFSLICS